MGGGRGKDKPHHPLMIGVQKVRIRPGKRKGKTDGWFPQPLTHNTLRAWCRCAMVCCSKRILLLPVKRTTSIRCLLFLGT